MKNLTQLNLRRVFRNLQDFGKLLLLATLFAACDGEDEPVPAYLHIAPFQLEATDLGIHGSISHKITHAKIFLKDKSSATARPHDLGTLTLPATVPVLVSGEWEVVADPVVKANGSSLTLAAYPFYKRFTSTLNLSPNVEDTLQPVTAYKDEAVFALIEDFEGSEQAFDDDRDENPATLLEISDADVFEGSRSGHLALDTANAAAAVATTKVFTLSPGDVYLEVNYKTDVPIEFGVLAVKGGVEEPNFEFVVLPKEEWNKIYFDLRELVSTAGTTQFILIFRAILPVENGAFTLDEADIFLDNIKLIHF